MSESPRLSIVVPFFNEEENIRPVYDELKHVFDAQADSYELIFVDDGSSDQTGAIADELALADEKLVSLRFKFNAGQTAAMQAGFDHARGEVIIPMDGDGQNDPHDIPALVAKLGEGFDVVSGWRVKRQDRALTRKLPSRIANALISRQTGVKLHDYGCSMKAYRRESLEGVRLYGEMHRFIPVYAAWNGARITEQPVNHRPRTRGTSKYGLSRVFKVILDLITIQFLGNYRTKPIYFFGRLGLGTLAIAFLLIVIAILMRLATTGDAATFYIIENPLTLVSMMAVILGIQFISLGVLAELQVRTYYESSRKLPYVVASQKNYQGGGLHDEELPGSATKADNPGSRF